MYVTDSFREPSGNEQPLTNVTNALRLTRPDLLIYVGDVAHGAEERTLSMRAIFRIGLTPCETHLEGLHLGP